MLFNSINFLIFFAVVTLIYFILPFKARWAWLLAASCFFYMAFIPYYIILLFYIVLVSYFSAILIEKLPKRKKGILISCIVAEVGLLFVFKYFNFFNANIVKLAGFLNWNYSLQALSLILPIGISFYTFQSMGYVIEVYRGKQKTERNLGIYSLYVLFYPQLVAGPIERSQNLLPQFRKKMAFDYSRVIGGLKLMLWGFFLKVVVADRIALVVDPIFNSPINYAGSNLVFATFLFPFQIFCDFAGYSTIAIGIAQVMGFSLMKNFDRPFISKSIAEFWRRWHISLSTWFRDYIYIPLGGSRVKKFRWVINIGIVFLISGLWHGANWTFIIWGGLHGFFIIFSVATINVRKKVSNKIFGTNERIKNVLSILFVFFIVSIAFVFFRANSVSDAWYILSNLFKNLNLSTSTWPFAKKDLLIAFISVIFMEGGYFINAKWGIEKTLKKWPRAIRWSAYILLILYLLLFGVFKSTKFIYFQF